LTSDIARAVRERLNDLEARPSGEIARLSKCEFIDVLDRHPHFAETLTEFAAQGGGSGGPLWILFKGAGPE